MVSGQEARIVQIDFSTAFDRVNHQGILYKLCSVGIGVSVMSILTQFLLNQSQHVMVDVFGVNWSMLCQICCREVFWGRHCSYYTLLSFIRFWRII